VGVRGGVTHQRQPSYCGGVPDGNELPQVLVIGLDPFRVPGPWDPQSVAEAIAQGMADLVDSGYAAESCLLALDGSADIESRLTTALEARQWDCVVVGGGLRKEDEQLELFECVINLVKDHAPQAPIAFSRTPHDLSDAVARVRG
jgi:hypothetical protein